MNMRVFSSQKIETTNTFEKQIHRNKIKNQL